MEETTIYGSEVGVLRRNLKRRIKPMKKPANLTKTLLNHIRTESIRESMKTKKTLTERIDEKRLGWVDHTHVIEENRLLKNQKLKVYYHGLAINFTYSIYFQ